MDLRKEMEVKSCCGIEEGNVSGDCKDEGGENSWSGVELILVKIVAVV